MSAFEDIAWRSPSTVRQLQECGSDEYDKSLIICPEALMRKLVAGTLDTTSRVKMGDAASSTLDSMQEVSIVCRDSLRLVLEVASTRSGQMLRILLHHLAGSRYISWFGWPRRLA
jgi:hypothetical protein